VSVPGVKPGLVARLPFAVAAICFLFAAETAWGAISTVVAERWFFGGLAALMIGAVTDR